MLLNEHTALVTPQILLCPYSEHHVPTYHEWMKDEELQALTASEPLSLPEEYDMQRSWRQDVDKLTFIACLPPSSSRDTVTPKSDDAPGRMIGDINLFLVDDDEGEDEIENGNIPATDSAVRSVLGEIEIMIAVKSQHRKGHGRAALLAFSWYILFNLSSILSEYSSGKDAKLRYLRVKIGVENAKSIALFESVGFVRTSAEPNYFGELELRLEVEGRVESALEELKTAKGWCEEPSVVEYRE